jgi:hypothetical protein
VVVAAGCTAVEQWVAKVLQSTVGAAECTAVEQLGMAAVLVAEEPWVGNGVHRSQCLLVVGEHKLEQGHKLEQEHRQELVHRPL